MSRQRPKTPPPDPRFLDTKDCEIVSDVNILYVLAHLGAPKTLVPGRGAVAYYVRRSDVQAAKTMLLLPSESEPV